VTDSSERTSSGIGRPTAKGTEAATLELDKDDIGAVFIAGRVFDRHGSLVRR